MYIPGGNTDVSGIKLSGVCHGLNIGTFDGAKNYYKQLYPKSLNQSNPVEFYNQNNDGSLPSDENFDKRDTFSFASTDSFITSTSHTYWSGQGSYKVNSRNTITSSNGFQTMLGFNPDIATKDYETNSEHTLYFEATSYYVSHFGGLFMCYRDYKKLTINTPNAVNSNWANGFAFETSVMVGVSYENYPRLQSIIEPKNLRQGTANYRFPIDQNFLVVNSREKENLIIWTNENSKVFEEFASKFKSNLTQKTYSKNDFFKSYGVGENWLIQRANLNKPLVKNGVGLDIDNLEGTENSLQLVYDDYYLDTNN